MKPVAVFLKYYVFNVLPSLEKLTNVFQYTALEPTASLLPGIIIYTYADIVEVIASYSSFQYRKCFLANRVNNVYTFLDIPSF